MIKTIDKTIAVLDLLLQTPKLGVTELGEMLNEDKSTIFRILATLEKHEMVTKDENSKKYSLGFGLLKYSAGIISGSNYTNIARPFLKDLKRKSKESSHICVLTKHDKAIFLDNINYDAVLNINTQIGTEQPLHAAAVAKSIVAYLPEDKQMEIATSINYIPFTIRTITSQEEFFAHLTKVQTQGYAIDDEEIYTGVRCIAAPIRDSRGKVFSSIGVSGPATRINLENINFYVDLVKKAAEDISPGTNISLGDVKPEDLRIIFFPFFRKLILFMHSLFYFLITCLILVRI